MGRRNALFYTACFSPKVEKLILVDARPRNNPQASEALRRHLISLPLVAYSLEEVGKAIQILYPFLSQEICHHIAQYGYTINPNGKYVPKYDTCMGLGSKRSGYFAEDLWPFLKNMICPTLILRGKESPFLSLDDAQKMHENPTALRESLVQSDYFVRKDGNGRKKSLKWNPDILTGKIHGKDTG